MSSLGSYLRELRERRGISLDEIARATRVGRPYLEALETSSVEKLPAPVFTRGFIRAYCQVLGEPYDDALALYEGRSREAASAHSEVRGRAPRTVPRGQGPVLVSFVLLLVLGIALFAVTMALQAGRQTPPVARTEVAPPQPKVASSETAQPAATPPTDMAATPVTTESATTPPVAGSAEPVVSPVSTANSATARPRPEASATSAPPVSERVGASTPPRDVITIDPLKEAERIAAAVKAPYRLVARTTEKTWIRVRTEDGASSEENVPAAQVREWVSNGRMVVSIGNAGGVKLELNGRSLPTLGARGDVIPKLVLPPQAP